VRGNPGDESSAIPKGWLEGQLEGWQLGTAEGCENRGDSIIHRRQSRRCGMRGNPSSTSRALQEEAGATGATRNPAETSTAEGDTKFGATRMESAGTAEGPEPRGNLRIRTPAQQKGSGYGATRSRNPGGAGRCRRRGDPQPHQQAERDDA